MQHFSKKCCIFYLTVTISDINSNTLHLITTYLKIIFAIYWLYLHFLTITSHKKLNWNPSFQFASLSSDLANRLHK